MQSSKKKIARKNKNVTPTGGLEPPTTWLRVKRSTDWARRAFHADLSSFFLLVPSMHIEHTIL